MDAIALAATVRRCTLCRGLPLGPRPLLQIHPAARVLIAGQAPGRRAHERGVPFDDPSGERLRAWLGLDRAGFYDERRIAIVPMGFCWPGSAARGDLPPRAECAPAWRERILASLPRVELTLAIGRYAQHWHLRGQRGSTVGETVARWRRFWPAIVPLPHPSPRNLGWFARHPFFERDVVPALRERLRELLR